MALQQFQQAQVFWAQMAGFHAGLFLDHRTQLLPVMLVQPFQLVV